MDIVASATRLRVSIVKREGVRASFSARRFPHRDTQKGRASMMDWCRCAVVISSTGNQRRLDCATVAWLRKNQKSGEGRPYISGYAHWQYQFEQVAIRLDKQSASKWTSVCCMTFQGLAVRVSNILHMHMHNLVLAFRSQRKTCFMQERALG